MTNLAHNKALLRMCGAGFTPVAYRIRKANYGVQECRAHEMSVLKQYVWEATTENWLLRKDTAHV